MKLSAGTTVLVNGGSLARGPRRGEVAVDYDGIGDVMVILDGKRKARPVDARRVRPAEPSREASRDAIPPPPASTRTRVVPVPEGRAAVLRAVPRPAPPARDASYLAFVREHPCCACGERTDVEAHHWAPRGRTGGIGRKPSDLRTVPLCRTCHQALHDTGELPALKKDARPCGSCGRRSSGVVASRFLLMAAQLDLRDEWDARGRAEGKGR